MAYLVSVIRARERLLGLFLALFALPECAGTLGFDASFKGEREGFDANLTQVLVTSVKAESPAERGGLKAGDLIKRVNGAAIEGSSSRDFYRTLSQVKPGTVVRLTVVRENKSLEIELIADAD